MTTKTENSKSELQKKKQIERLLSAKNAPKGAVERDFSTALYLVAALYQVDFGTASNLGMCANLLGTVGFRGSLAELDLADYQTTLAKLEKKGALVRLGDSQVYAAKDEVSVFVAKVRAKEDTTYFAKDREKHFIFYVEDAQGEEYLLRSGYVILPNDEVEVCAVKKDGVVGRAFVSSIIKKRVCVLGRIMLTGGKSRRVATIMPDEPNLKSLVFEYEANEDLGQAESGDVVIAEIVKRLADRCYVKTREVVRNLGNLNSIIVRAVMANDLPVAWPDNVIHSLSRVPKEVKSEETKGREDLRELPLVTIDGEDARDFDDAVYCRREGSKWRLYVSIADVSYYVKVGTLLDKEAALRCNSNYFPNYVIPMLPEKLSNGICSLNPMVDRLCMTCEMVISAKGEIEKYEFYPAVMRSHARLTYSEAWQMITEGTTKIPEHEEVIADVAELYKLYKALNHAREKRGGLSIESTEVIFSFNEQMEITGIEPLVRNDAHKLIEECMIAANVAAATFVSEHKSQTLYRVHAKPTEKKLSLLSGQLARFGLSLTGGDDPKPQDYARLYQAISARNDADILGELLLRSMSKAEYSPDNIGHFGLALEKYAHFTSPIRRYADLQLHRVIKYLLEKDKKRSWGKIGAKAYTKEELLAIGSRCNDRELAADTAEHQVDFELSCVFLQQFIGEKLEGTITACTSFGAFVRLDRFMVDGMIYIGNFPSYMEYNEKNQTLVSERGKVYSIGQKLTVILASVDPEAHKIDLFLPGSGMPYAKGPAPKKKKKGKKGEIEETPAVVDKEIIFKRIADISRVQDATNEDLIKKAVKESDFGTEFENTAHYANPLEMPGAYDISVPFGKSKKGDAKGGGKKSKRNKRSKR
ncbi:MAG: ribonuclease R [Succinivibrio sp.]|nr:ribonuclease R [Succinivibrio sp.]